MKCNLKVLFTGMLCLACLPVMPLNAFAEVQEDGYDYAGDSGSSYHCTILEADTFKYTTYSMYESNDPASALQPLGAGNLETDIVDVNFIVTGVFYREDETEPLFYTMNELGKYGAWAVECASVTIAPYLDGEILKAGDLLYIENYSILEKVPGVLQLEEYADPTIQVLGSGIDIFGEDFKKVLYYECYEAPLVGNDDGDLVRAEESGYVYEAITDYDKGNINNDDKIDIVDCIALNKNLMTGYQISYYAQGCADVDGNGVVNATDSLNILKYVVGIIDSFEEIQN